MASQQHGPTDPDLTDVPLDLDGNPMLAAQNPRDVEIYVNWLGDYLYRPTSEDLGATLSEDAAWGAVIKIEIEIADFFWTRWGEDWPPEDKRPSNGARHADILHRKELSRILSRVPEISTRVRLLKGFYQELIDDFHK